ncbi:MAG: diaminopimelate decarboxylase [Bacteroidota bacterium]
MFTEAHVDFFNQQPTPFYYYDMDLLNLTLRQVKKWGLSKGFHVHYALKANNHIQLLQRLQEAGLGADCVSGGEIERAIEGGFSPDQIAFAGVGKSDQEIELALSLNIFCFNVESIEELTVLNEIAGKKGQVAPIALRINPDVDAKTHRYITTGLSENKFGINEESLAEALTLVHELDHIQLIGIHFHIGSQINQLEPFQKLVRRANELNQHIEAQGHHLTVINVGGGFGINYEAPDAEPIPDFERFFGLFESSMNLKNHQQLHFELGRSVVGQCGSLITKVLYTKPGRTRKFAIVDAGMTELLRPALYQATHHMEVLTSDLPPETYDIVGPICESSDTFRKSVELSGLQRGDIIAMRSTGAYGEVMTSRYNLRPQNPSVFSSQIPALAT